MNKIVYYFTSALILLAFAVAGVVLTHRYILPHQSSTAAESQQIPARDYEARPPAPSSRATAGPVTRYSSPDHITIPAVGVNARVVPVSFVNGVAGVPSDKSVTGWIKQTAAPGQPGPALIDGHVDSYAGPGAFFWLKNLTRGDPIYVHLTDGVTVTYSVDAVQAVPKSSFPWSEVLKSSPQAELRLVTCGGAFDYDTGHYADNIIVYARIK